jgi:HrpA-like RNA helicase
VIDSCRVKEMDFDVEKQMKALIMKKASKDSLRQRKGRAGRVQAGRYFLCIYIHEYTYIY